MDIGCAGFAKGSSDGNMIGMRSGRLFGLLNCWDQARLDGSWLANGWFIDVPDIGSGVCILPVNSPGVDAIQADYVPLSEGWLLPIILVLSKLLCLRFESDVLK